MYSVQTVRQRESVLKRSRKQFFLLKSSSSFLPPKTNYVQNFFKRIENWELYTYEVSLTHSQHLKTSNAKRLRDHVLKCHLLLRATRRIFKGIYFLVHIWRTISALIPHRLAFFFVFFGGGDCRFQAPNQFSLNFSTFWTVKFYSCCLLARFSQNRTISARWSTGPPRPFGILFFRQCLLHWNQFSLNVTNRRSVCDAVNRWKLAAQCGSCLGIHF